MFICTYRYLFVAIGQLLAKNIDIYVMLIYNEFAPLIKGDFVLYDYNITGNIKIFRETILDGQIRLPRSRRIHESLLYVTEGNLLFEQNGVKTVVKKGQIAYIGRGNEYDELSPYMCERVTLISTNFNYIEGSHKQIPSLPFQTLCSEGSPRYETLFLKAYHTFIMHLPAYMINARSLLLEIIGKLYNEYTLSDSQLKKFNEIKIGIDYIKTNFNNYKLKVSDVAQVCNMSERTLRRLFISCYNKTPFAFLQEFRINQAEILLTSTQNPITEISSQCGFSDIYAFSHCFKMHNNMSPTEYRKTYRK